MKPINLIIFIIGLCFIIVLQNEGHVDDLLSLEENLCRLYEIGKPREAEGELDEQEPEDAEDEEEDDDDDEDDVLSDDDDTEEEEEDEEEEQEGFGVASFYYFYS